MASITLTDSMLRLDMICDMIPRARAQNAYKSSKPQHIVCKSLRPSEPKPVVRYLPTRFNSHKCFTAACGSLLPSSVRPGKHPEVNVSVFPHHRTKCLTPTVLCSQANRPGGLWQTCLHTAKAALQHCSKRTCEHTSLLSRT